MIYITNNIVHFPRNSKEDVVLLHLVNQLTQSVIDVEVTNTSTNGKIYTFDISSAIAKMVAGQYDYFLYTTDSQLVGSGILQVDNYKTEDVTYNVNYDIIQYSPDEEEVVVPLRKLTIIENGEYDVTNVDEVIVNVNQNDDKIEELEANIDELEANNLGLTNSLNSANSTIEELEGDISNLNQRISYLNEDINGLNDNINQLTTQRNNLQTQVDNLTVENTNLTNSINDLNNKINALNEEKTALQAEIDGLRKQISTLIAERDKLTTENAEYVTLINSLNERISTLLGEVDVKNSTISDLENRIASLQSQVDNLTSQNENLSALNAGYVGQIATLNSEISTLQTQVGELQRDIIVKQEEIESLRLTVESKTEELQNAEVEIADKTNQITNLTNQINTLQREVVVLTERVEILEEYFGQTGTQLINRIADLEGQVEDLQTQIEELQRVVVVKQEEIETLNAEITRLTSEVEEKQAYIDTATGVTITTNGTYTPEEGIIGWNEVIVNVEGEIVNTQEKSVEYTENGTYTVVPDDGYYLTGVNVDVNVEGIGGGVTELPIIDNPDNYFYIQSAEDNNIIYFDSSNTRNKYNITSHRSKLEYSYDGTNWTSLNGVSSLPLEKYGDYIFIRNVSTTNITPQRGGSGFSTTFSLFGAEYPVKVGGNAQKLLSNYANPTSVSYIYLFANYRATGNYKYDNIACFDIEVPNGTSVSRMFYRDEGIDTLPTIEGLSISGTDTATNFSYMFNGCSSLTEVPLFDTSNGTNFSNMFQNCSSLTEVPLFDTSNSTNFSYMFNGCSSLTEVPQLDTTNSTNFGYMFRNCTSLVTAPQLDTSNGTNFINMFNSCELLTTIPQLDVSNGTNFNQMFKGCTLLTDVTFVGSINSSIDFSECSLLTNDAIKSILTACAATTNTTAKTVSFDNILLIKEIIGEDVDTLIETCLSKGWTISGLALIEEPAVEESEYFYIKALNPLQSTKVTISNTTLLYEQKPYYEFSLDAINWFDLEVLRVSEFILEENDKLYLRVKENIENSGSPIVVTSDYVLIGGRAIALLSNDNTISNMEDLFSSSGVRLAYSHCDLSYSNNLMDTFAHLGGKDIFDRLAVVNLNNSDTTNSTNFSNMFYRRKYLKQIIGILDTSNGTNFSNMFNSCELLVTAPQLDTSKNTNFGYMFGYCHSLTTIPQLDVSNATNTFGMLGSCYNLTNITFVGSINSSIDFLSSPLLTYDSIKSILTACAATTNTTAKTLKFDSTIADTEGELATLVSSCTSKGWTVSGLVLE